MNRQNGMTKALEPKPFNESNLNMRNLNCNILFVANVDLDWFFKSERLQVPADGKFTHVGFLVFVDGSRSEVICENLSYKKQKKTAKKVP